MALSQEHDRCNGEFTNQSDFDATVTLSGSRPEQQAFTCLSFSDNNGNRVDAGSRFDVQDLWRNHYEESEEICASVGEETRDNQALEQHDQQECQFENFATQDSQFTSPSLVSAVDHRVPSVNVCDSDVQLKDDLIKWNAGPNSFICQTYSTTWLQETNANEVQTQHGESDCGPHDTRVRCVLEDQNTVGSTDDLTSLCATLECDSLQSEVSAVNSLFHESSSDESGIYQANLNSNQDLSGQQLDSHCETLCNATFNATASSEVSKFSDKSLPKTNYGIGDSHMSLVCRRSRTINALASSPVSSIDFQSPRVSLKKRYSMPENLDSCVDQKIGSTSWRDEPIHMTLEEVRSSLQKLLPENGKHLGEKRQSHGHDRRGKHHFKRSPFTSCLRWRRVHDDEGAQMTYSPKHVTWSFKQALCGWFGVGHHHSSSELDQFSVSGHCEKDISMGKQLISHHVDQPSKLVSLTPYLNRALPPVPGDMDSAMVKMEGDDVSDGIGKFDEEYIERKRLKDFASSIEKVKDCGWYWGPLSGEMAEKILAVEPDGSFIVRDSSDEHYIFSLTFKLNGLVRHVRIEHNHGNFSFGTFTNFKSHTIVEFIESAVEHSRSGRYLFFLHRRPILGPMRVQLLYPVSRFKQVQSLQHMCRFVILKVVRRDLISYLPLPKRMKDYLDTPQYYSEVAEELQMTSDTFDQPSTPSEKVESVRVAMDSVVLSDEVTAGNELQIEADSSC